MAVIAQRQRLGERAGQGLEAAEMAQPFFLAEPAKANAFGPALVAVAQHRLWKIGRRNGIEEGAAQRLMGFGGDESGHVRATLAERVCFVARATPICAGPAGDREQIGL